MKLEIISPEKTIYKGDATLVTLPGVMGSFTVLDRHAPIISALEKGTITYEANGKRTNIEINEGFVEARENTITVCVE